MSHAWKEKERLVARWFDSHRNPLSGRNNFDDCGQERIGDIIYPHAVIEVRSRKSVNMELGRAARESAGGKKPWLAVEFRAGYPEIVKLTMNYELAQTVCRLLHLLWTDGKTT